MSDRVGGRNGVIAAGAGVGVPLSDMNGMGRFWVGRAWFDAYWSAFAVILVVIAYALWRRGTETRFMPRLRRAPARLKGVAGLTAGVAADRHAHLAEQR